MLLSDWPIFFFPPEMKTQQEITFTGTRNISSHPEAGIQPNLNVMRDLSRSSLHLNDLK